MSLILSERRLEFFRKKTISFIKSKVRESKTKGVILGLSGGIDSALVAKLCVESGVDIHVLIMPGKGVSARRDTEDAIRLARKLKIKYDVIEISRIIESITKTLPETALKKNKIALGNIKPRVRMMMLYFYANLENRLVVGTGNKTELTLGYFTKYGDGGVDFLPIGCLYKTQVRQLARHVGLPKEIIPKVPSAGLWAGQTDEGEIGLKYEDMDNILSHLEKYSPKETVKKLGLDRNSIELILGRMSKNKHKLRIPPVLKLF